MLPRLFLMTTFGSKWSLSSAWCGIIFWEAWPLGHPLTVSEHAQSLKVCGSELPFCCLSCVPGGDWLSLAPPISLLWPPQLAPSRLLFSSGIYCLGLDFRAFWFGVCISGVILLFSWLLLDRKIAFSWGQQDPTQRSQWQHKEACRETGWLRAGMI